MTFQYYKSFYSQKQKRWCPGVSANVLTEDIFKEIISDITLVDYVEKYQQGDKEAKTKLPAVCWCGVSETSKRIASDMTPTQHFICDIDHIGENHNPAWVWEQIKAKIDATDYDFKIRLVHITPSGKGLRIVARATQNFVALIEHMQWLNKILELDSYGDFDTAVKDLSRLSFLVPQSYILYYDCKLFADNDTDFLPIKKTSDVVKVVSDFANNTTEYGEITNKYKDIEFRGNKVSDIVSKYVEVHGEPGDGERHNFYNLMVRDFRHICDNDPQKVFAVLPRYGQGDAEYMSQCQSICRTNTVAKIPRDFFFFLKDNGFYKKEYTTIAEQDAYMFAEEEDDAYPLPNKLPPVFREILSIAPKDFVFPSAQALLPILGTLTSHLRAEYWHDLRVHSTEFFSVLYAGSGMGKGFVERFIELLTDDLILRDLLCSERENIYNRFVNRNKKNEKDPENPRVTMRIMEPKCSEAEFLEKQQSNDGHHMFTYAAEMDQWAKGSRAAGGSKDDMLRIAWDNGFYGQQFKSTNTFKGRIRLYWNVLITGTEPQLWKYFKDVENGLFGRCGFAAIRNQEFSEAPTWKKLSKKALNTIETWKKRMDAANYKEPLDPHYAEAVLSVSEEEYDNEIPWKYEWQPFKEVDMRWLKPTLDKFEKEQQLQASLDRDKARDSFRRRSQVRGFRLGLLCTELWPKVGEAEKDVIKEFVWWFMHHDLNEILALGGQKYNDICEGSVIGNVPRKSLYQMLEETFTDADLYAASKRCGVRSPIRAIVHDWKKIGKIQKIEKGIYKKINK